MRLFKGLRYLVPVMMILGSMGVCSAFSAGNGDLDTILKTGVIRHLGVPYANFVTGSGDGFSVELIQNFAADLGVEYRYVKAGWSDVIGRLTGKTFTIDGDHVTFTGERSVEGDIIGNGLTELEWRKELLDYSLPTFQTQVWLISGADSSLTPITPGKDTAADIAAVKAQLSGISVLGMSGTCVDPALYQLKNHDADVVLYQGNLNEMAPAVMNGIAQATLLDVPDSLVALQKWPGVFKIIGPVSAVQNMGMGFRKDAPALRNRFNAFLKAFRKDGRYLELVRKYYPTALYYFENFFTKK